MQILSGIADTVAQTLTAIRQNSLQQCGDFPKDDYVSIEIHELDRKTPLSPMELNPPSRNLPPPFDFERLTRFMGYGFMMSPVQYHWFGFLNRSFPITKTAMFVPAMKRVALDQLMFAPVGRLSHTFCRQATWDGMLTPSRSCMLLHIHDIGGRRREAGCDPEVSRCLSAST